MDGNMYILGDQDQRWENLKDIIFSLDHCDLALGLEFINAKIPKITGGVAAGIVVKKNYVFGGEGIKLSDVVYMVIQEFVTQQRMCDPVRVRWE